MPAASKIGPPPAVPIGQCACEDPGAAGAAKQSNSSKVE